MHMYAVKYKAFCTSKFHLFHIQGKIFSVSTWVCSLLLQVTCKKYTWNELPVVGMGKKEVVAAGRQLAQEDAGALSRCSRRKCGALTLASQWPSRCSIHNLKQEEGSQSFANAYEEASLFNLYQQWHSKKSSGRAFQDCSDRVLIRHGQEFAKTNSLVCWLWQLATVWKPLL